MFEKTQINEHVRDLADAASLVIKYGSGTVRVLEKDTGTLLGSGENIACACRSALNNDVSAQYGQALFAIGALSFGPTHLFSAFEELWGGDDDEDDDEDEDEDDYDDEDDEDDEDEDEDEEPGEGSIHFQRG